MYRIAFDRIDLIYFNFDEIITNRNLAKRGIKQLFGGYLL